MGMLTLKSNTKEQTMYNWESMIKQFNKSQFLIGNLERLTRDQSEIEEARWSKDDCPPEQRLYEDKQPYKKCSKKPF